MFPAMILRVKNLTKLVYNIFKTFLSMVGSLMICIRARITSQVQVTKEMAYRLGLKYICTIYGHSVKLLNADR